MSDEKPKPAPVAAPPAAPAGPPKLERVPAGYRPPSAKSPAAGTQPARPPSPQPPPPAEAGGEGASAAAPGRGVSPSPPAAAGGAASPPRPPGASYGLAARVVGADAALAAGLAHEGTLAKEGALHLFALAAALQATGRLTLSPEERSYALSFRRGTVAHAASTDPEEDLGRFLVKKGALSEAQREKAEAAKARAGGDLAAALVAERIVNPADVAALLQEHGGTIVQRALAIEAGGWAWAPDAAPPPSSFPLGAPLAMLCQAVRASDASALARRLGDREHRAASRAGGRIRIEDLRLTPQEARAAQLFDGVRSPAEIAAASPGDALVVLRLALLLGEAELLAFGAARRPAPAPVQAARPAPTVAPSAPPGPGAPPAAARPPVPPAPGASPAAARPPVQPRPPASAPPPRPAPAKAAPPPATPARPATTPAPKPAAPAPLEPVALQALVKRLREADHFEVLGLRRDAAGPQIKLAYFQLAKTYHPDAIPPDAAPEVRKLCADVFAKVSEAWSALGEDGSRAAYLALLQAGGPASLDVQNIFQAENAFQAGTMLAKARRYDEALARFDEAIRLNPDEAEFSMWKAWCEFLLSADKKKNLPASGGAVEAALRRNPRCAQGYLFLGQMAKIAGDLALAEKQLRRGLQVAPEHPELQRELKYLRK